MHMTRINGELLGFSLVPAILLKASASMAQLLQEGEEEMPEPGSFCLSKAGYVPNFTESIFGQILKKSQL